MTDTGPLHDAAIFDLDGVLVDTARLHWRAWSEVAGEYGFAPGDDVAEAVKGVGRTAAVAIVFRSGGVALGEAEAHVAADRKNTLYQRYLADLGSADLLPGAVETLETLRAWGLPIGLASASRSAREVLARTGIEDYFDAIVDGTVISQAKPDPAVFLEAAVRLGVLPWQAVVFEDASAGVEGARRAGCHVVGIGDPGVLAAADTVVASLESAPLTELFRKHVP
ncbi:beta-phosphoglucomutase family hydrolase [Herbidospora galbida]|uniref:Beta-phosphoglucomutase family hydrolase n=1 Tax=Herbidospora galbida TaxID=2575442 RepID=A0A4U3M9V4_9ACTN|nr:beta-phosphoglucomutase family hydrolase [Herbidospora galbida]TKK85360.1 beta-phosphoglucomutase family hydrolase [Herbidospora galbida]